ncbi:MoxR-like ATPase [Salsuginibacillus halophilus]|uniref:MoxR-like ATPase n=1 Tax=Salsuginibacillus halophilus TaxID=517424 RepID=A0A2P8HLE0_9BACI|nr:MoxR family ATPase [Salsuginibacillus halophilus]PSL47000.1 MoxR-like ATPase [Salsuginibacillus halophilus]
MSEYIARIQKLKQNIQQVVVGKDQEIELSLAALLAGGHVLLEDVPGVGKTMMVRAVAQSIGAEFKRIQFTPDLLPSDVTGVSVFNQRTQMFEYREGPVMANVVLADEINRTSPKTQSALLEALEEQSVTVDGETKRLKDPFFLMATQNPIEYGGTYPLPEAQLDRFLFKIKLGYPNREEELEVLSRTETSHPIETLEPVVSLEDIAAMRAEVENVYVDEAVKSYLLSIVRATRTSDKVELGVSPRGSIALMKAAQAYAYLQHRDYVIPDDIKQLVPYVLPHRMMMRNDLYAGSFSEEEVLQAILAETAVPASSRQKAAW